MPTFNTQVYEGMEISIQPHCPPPHQIHLLCTKVKEGKGCLSMNPLTLDQFLVSSLLHTGDKPEYQCTLMPAAHIDRKTKQLFLKTSKGGR
jgi:hypothetical protein